MRSSSRMVLPALVMLVVTASATGTALLLLYDAAFEQARARLTEIARSHARLIESIARHEAQFAHVPTDSQGHGDVAAAALEQLREAQEDFPGLGTSGEFTLARRVGDQIDFLLDHRYGALMQPTPLRIGSELAEPMQAALQGRSGTMTGRDYRGARVLAAFEPVAELDWGIVAKIDLAEIRAPFIRAALLAAGLACVLVLLGVFCIVRVGRVVARELFESERKYRTLFESATDGVFVFSDVTVDCNEPLARLMGGAREDVLGHPPSDFWPPTQPDGRASALAAQPYIDGALSGVTQRFVWRHRRIDGTLFDADVALKAVTLGGRPLLLGTLRDITERRKNEQALESMRLLLEAVVEQSPVPVAVAGMPDQVIRYANHAAAELLGLGDEHAYLGLTLAEVMARQPWRDLSADGTPIPLAEMPLARALRGETTRNVECRVIRGDGTQRWELVNGTPLYNRAGELIAGLIVFPDITEHKQAEETLRASEERFRSLYGGMAEGVALHTLIRDERGIPVNYRLTAVNPRYEQTVGLAAANVVGKLATEAYSTPEPPYLREFASAVEAGQPSRFETYFEPLKRHLAVSVAPLGGDQFATIFFDMTDHKRLEEQLRQSQKMEAVGQLAGGVAHDFNNILTGILGNAELALDQLQSERPDHAQVRAELQQIERNAQRAANLTRQLLAFSRRQVMRPEIVDLNRALIEMEPMLRRLIAENIALQLRPAANLWTVRADAGQIEQVVLNLVVNARDAMPDGGRLTIGTGNVTLDADYAAQHADARAGAHVVLTVSDTGHGMDTQTREHIFEPFFTTKPVGAGTGLGLATVYGIAKQGGGHVTVYSEPGHGSVFRVYLPATAGVVTPHAPEPAADADLSGHELVLVCEDDDMVRDLAVQILERAGYGVLTAASAAEALRAAKTHAGSVDLLVTDVVMPDMNGRALAHALSALQPAVRVLYISGYTADVIAHHGVLDEGVEFLEKPFSRRALLQRIRALLGPPPPAAGREPSAAAQPVSPARAPHDLPG